MKRFTVPDQNAREFVDGVRRALSGRSLGQMVTLDLEGTQLVVRLSKMGTTELKYDVVPQGAGFVANLTQERVAPFHAPFRADFEHKLEQVLQDLGADLG